MAELHLHEKRRTLRAAGVVTALCVCGFAGLALLHGASTPSVAASALPSAVGNSSVAGDAVTSGTTGVPSAESVFRGALYTAPDEAIAQF